MHVLSAVYTNGRDISMLLSYLFFYLTDGELMAECIQIISLTPRSCAPKWRIRVFLKAFVSIFIGF